MTAVFLIYHLAHSCKKNLQSYSIIPTLTAGLVGLMALDEVGDTGLGALGIFPLDILPVEQHDWGAYHTEQDRSCLKLAVMNRVGYC